MFPFELSFNIYGTRKIYQINNEEDINKILTADEEYDSSSLVDYVQVLKAKSNKMTAVEYA